jgi:desulfoferrodoxin (superoxide reductase-like protein)
MKPLKIIILITGTLVLFSPQLFSHSPEKIELTFNQETKILDIDVQHEVRNIEKHYVDKIEVFLNDELRIVQNFKKQESKKSQKTTFFLFDVEVGDKVKVKANCSIHGDKTKEITISQEPMEK